jgi:hypothetical protein
MTRHLKQAPAPNATDAACDGCKPHAHGTPETGETAPGLQLDSTITCPKCGTATRLRMPTDACQFFWECPDCGALLKPKRGDCCVFCSWGDVPCPPVQAGRIGCG